MEQASDDQAAHSATRVAAAQPHGLPALAISEVEQLDEEREGHRDVDVGLGHVLTHPVGHEHHADEEQEGQREDLHARVALDEAGHGAHAGQHHEHGDHHGRHHDRQAVGHADGGDHGVEGEPDVEHEDLGEHAGEAPSPASLALDVLDLELVVDLPRRLADQEEAAADQDEVASTQAVAQHGEQRPRESHHPRDREEQPDADAQREREPEPPRRILLPRGQPPGEDRDEDDVVDAEDDFERGQRRERDQAVGVEYALPSVPHDDALPGAVWHTHEASCHYRDFRELPAASARACPARHPASGEVFVGWHPALAVAHVWAWYPNPDGVFAEANPWLAPYGGLAAREHHPRNPAEMFYSQLTHRVAGVILLTLAALTLWESWRPRPFP